LIFLPEAGKPAAQAITREIIFRIMTVQFPWPDGLDPDTICFTVDVEWAADAVLADLKLLFEQHEIRATFFVTHAGVETPGHERALHPNFRRNGDTYKLVEAMQDDPAALSEEETHRRIISRTLEFAPEAKGLRSHSLHYDSTLLPIYQGLGLEYDSSYRIPLVGGLRPFWTQYEILEIPTYYADYFDLVAGATGFELERLALDRPGLKVFDFHPNIIFTNASSNADYLATKSFYHDEERLVAARRSGKGARTLLLDLLETVRGRGLPTATLGEVNAQWRSVPKWT
jgi:hypothetical protein